MKVLHLIRTVRRESGGPAEGLRRILAGYIARGHSAEVVSLDPPDATGVAEGVFAPTHLLGVSEVGYGRSPDFRRWLRDNAGRFDAAVVHGLWQYQGYAALQELRGRRSYAVFTHGMLDPWFNRTYPLKKLKKLPYWLLVERRLLASAHRVLFTSTVEARLAPTSFPFSEWKAEVVPYGTSGPPEDAATEVRAFHRRVPELQDQAFILYAGRLHAKKGCDMLLRAYAHVTKTERLPRLMIAGPDQGQYATVLKSLSVQLGIADRVVWPGMLEGASKWGAFRAAEVFVLPSHQENFGIAVAEALSCGTPVLISDQVNIHSDIATEAAGFVEPDTLEGTVRLLQNWSHVSATDRDAMRSAAYACWGKHFNSANTSEAIIKLFHGRE